VQGRDGGQVETNSYWCRLWDKPSTVAGKGGMGIGHPVQEREGGKGIRNYGITTFRCRVGREGNQRLWDHPVQAQGREGGMGLRDYGTTLSKHREGREGWDSETMGPPCPSTDKGGRDGTQRLWDHPVQAY